MSYSIATIDEVKERIWSIIHQTPAFDICTDLFDLRFDPSCIRSGIDELLTTDALTAELFRHNPYSLCNPGQELTYDEYTCMPLRIKSELVWHRLFLAGTPLSEATRTVLTALGMLQIDPKTRNLGAFRNFFNKTNLQQHISTIIDRANLSGIVCSYNPLDADTLRNIQKPPSDSRFHTALNLTPLVCEWKKNYALLNAQGITVRRVPDKTVYASVSDFLLQIIEASGAVYITLQLPAGLSFSCKSNNTLKLLTKCIIPMLLKAEKPLLIRFNAAGASPALNEFKINQPLQFSNTDFIRDIIERYPELKLIVADTDSANQQRLILLAQKCSNLMPIICSRSLAAQSSFSSISQFSLEILGSRFIAHSAGATVYEELLADWAHNRWILGTILQERYAGLYRTGWKVTEQELNQEISGILAGNARQFLNLY